MLTRFQTSSWPDSRIHADQISDFKLASHENSNWPDSRIQASQTREFKPARLKNSNLASLQKSSLPRLENSNLPRVENLESQTYQTRGHMADRRSQWHSTGCTWRNLIGSLNLTILQPRQRFLGLENCYLPHRERLQLYFPPIPPLSFPDRRIA